MFSDLRFAVRSLVKVPGFSLVSLLILALAIGAITAVFSAVEAVLLHPLPYTRPSELYSIESAVPNQSGLFSIPEYCAYRDQNRSFQGLAAVSPFNTNLMSEGEAQSVRGVRISANAFEVLGAKPLAGRLLVPADDEPGAAKVVVIAEGLWQRAFGGKLDAIGRRVFINGQPSTIVGVLPSGFVLPIVGYYSDICVPLQADADPMRYQQGSLHFLSVMGRLTAGVTETQALSDLTGVLQNLRKAFPREYGDIGVNHITTLSDQIVANSRPMLLTLFGLVAALLLLASANLAGLQLVRAIGRNHEFAVRTAVGASRMRLMRLVVAECFVLAVVGGIGGLPLAQGGLEALASLIPADLPRGQNLNINGAVFAFAAIVSLGFGLAPALAPIWLVSRADLRSAIAAGSRRTAGGQKRVHQILAGIQVALALALLACTGLFLRSFWALGAERLGFDTSNALAVRVTMPEAGYGDVASQVRAFERMQARLKAITGVEKVGGVGLLPLAQGLATINFTVTGQAPARVSDLPSANYRLVTTDYFEAMHIAVRQGRDFTDRDDGTHPLVVVVSTALAEAIFHGHNPVGQRLDLQDTAVGVRTAEIIGVVDDVKQVKIEDPPSFDVYVSYRQMDPTAVTWNRYRMFWVARGPLPAVAMAATLRRTIHAEDASVAISSIRTLEQMTDAALAARRFSLVIVGFFAGTALLLTVAGIYSVIAFGVAQRTREFGVRLALGATPKQISGSVFGGGLVIVGFGAPIGILASLLLSRLIATQLYGVSPYDPTALTTAVLVIAIIAFLASWLPARRAAQVNPIEALRAD